MGFNAMTDKDNIDFLYVLQSTVWNSITLVDARDSALQLASRTGELQDPSRRSSMTANCSRPRAAAISASSAWSAKSELPSSAKA